MKINTLHRSLSPPRLLLVTLLLLTATTAFTSTSTATETTAETTTETTTETATDGMVHRELRVIVTLADEPYHGLTQGDIRLTLEGQEVQVLSWEEFTPTQGNTSLRLLVFIDEAFALPSLRKQALLELRRTLATLPAKESMTLAVAAFDGERVELLTPWTSSPSAVNAALDQGQQRPTFGLLRQSEHQKQLSLGRRRSHLPDAGSFSGTGFAGSTLSAWEEQESGTELLRRRALLSAQAAALTLETLGAAQEGSALLLLSGGWLPPSAPAAACETLVEPLLQAARRNAFAIYPVDVVSKPGQGFAPPAEDGLLVHLAQNTGGSLARPLAAAGLRRALADARSHYRVHVLLPEDAEGAGDLHLEILPGAAPREHLTTHLLVFPKPAPDHPPRATETFFPLIPEKTPTARTPTTRPTP